MAKTSAPQTGVDGETGEVLADGDEFQHEVDPVQVISKITIAEIGGNPSLAKSRQERVPVAAFMGRCVDTKLVEDPTSQKTFTAVVGAFHAINLQTGAEYRSGVMYLPDAFQSLVIAALEHSREAPSRRGLSHFRGVEFSYRIDAKPASNPSGYSYVLTSMMRTTANDPTAHLRAHAMRLLGADTRLSLPAPEASA